MSLCFLDSSLHSPVFNVGCHSSGLHFVLCSLRCHVFQSDQQHFKSPPLSVFKRRVSLMVLLREKKQKKKKQVKDFDFQHFRVKKKKKSPDVEMKSYYKNPNMYHVENVTFDIWMAHIKRSTRGYALIRHRKLYSRIFIWMFLSLMGNLNFFLFNLFVILFKLSSKGV